MNRKAQLTVKTTFGDSDPFIITDLVKHGTCLGPILNNCSLSDMCKHCSLRVTTLIMDLCKSNHWNMLMT